MSDSVRASWIAFTESFEGGVPSLYADIRGLVTIAYGNLCDSPGQASTLQLVHPDGSAATTAEKVSAWWRVKDDPKAASLGWRYAATLTPLRLTKDGMADLAYRKLATNESAMLVRFPEWAEYPACAQMALHSLCWAVGPAFHFPKLEAAVNARDWSVAAVEIHMNERTPEGKLNAGLVPRNEANHVLMLNAATVDAFHLDPELLEWRTLLSADNEPTNPGTVPTIYAGSCDPPDDAA